MNIISTDQQPIAESPSSEMITPSPVKLPDSEIPKKPAFGQKQIKALLAAIFLVLLVLGGSTALYLTQVSQDLRQQASTVGYGPGYKCNLNDPNACNGHPEQCHCLGGDACTGTECDPDLEQQCKNQGRSYCTNYQGQGTTCCVAGYHCCENSDGCCNDGGPTKNPTDKPDKTPTPTSTHITVTPTPTRVPSISPTATPVHSPTPTPTTPTVTLSPTPTIPGPQCYSIGMYDIEGQEITGDMDQQLTTGTPVRFRCGATGGTPDRYEFRVLRPDGILEDKDTNSALEAVGSTTGNYALPLTGDYAVQCRICVGTTCHPYEQLPGTAAAPTCGGIAGITCPDGFNCELDGTYPDAAGTCQPVDGEQAQ